MGFTTYLATFQKFKSYNIIGSEKLFNKAVLLPSSASLVKK